MKEQSLRIAIVGYGKMGKTIERLAEDRGHSIVATIERKNKNELDLINTNNCDVAIEFSSPESVLANLEQLSTKGINTVCGTTAWLEHYDKICQQFQKSKSGFLYASNFSIGVNIFFKVNKILAELLAPRSEYNVSMREEHHIQKKDAPSGTAISLINDILDSSTTKSSWSLTEKTEENIHIEAIREGDIKGTHIVNYDSSIDSISICHTAHTREGFAMGAILAAEFLYQKEGIFSMQDVLDHK